MRVTKALVAASIVVSIAACRTSAAKLEPPDDSPTSPRAEQARLPQVGRALSPSASAPSGEEGASFSSPHRHDVGPGQAHRGTSSQGEHQNHER
jgi:hypothetical protein